MLHYEFIFFSFTVWKLNYTLCYLGNTIVNCSPLVFTIYTMAGVGILLVISCRETAWVPTMTVLEVLSPPVENMIARLSFMGFIMSCHLYTVLVM